MAMSAELAAFVDAVMRQYAAGMLLHVVPWASGSSMTRNLRFRYHEAQGILSLPIYWLTPLDRWIIPPAINTTLVWIDDSILPTRVYTWMQRRAFSAFKLAAFVSARHGRERGRLFRAWEEVGCRPGSTSCRKAAAAFAARAH